MAELNGNEELIELEDEDGGVLTYRLLQELEWNGVTYAILEDTEDDEGYVSVFRVTDGNMILPSRRKNASAGSLTTVRHFTPALASMRESVL